MLRAVLTAVLALALLAPAAPAAAATPKKVRCTAKEKRAKIGGKVVCLKKGKRCVAKYQRQYKRYGFRCTRKRLALIPKPPAATSPTSPGAATPAPGTPAPGTSLPGGGAPSSDTAGQATITVAESVLRPGSSVRVTGRGFAPGSPVGLVLHSTPTDVGTAGAGPDGTFSQTVAIPETVEGGDHHLVGSGTDASGNSVAPSVALTVDVTPPTIVSVTAEPATAGPGDTILVTGHVTDDTSVRAVGLQASLVGSEGTWSFCDSYAQHTGGTGGDGTWTMSCTVPQNVLNGTYSIYPYAQDIAGNWVNTNGGPSSAVRGEFTITGGFDHVDPPAIESIDVTPATAEPGDTITVSAHVTSQVGLKMIELQARRDGDGGSWTFCDKWGTLTSGTAQDGVWSITCTVPDQVLNGSYTVTPYAQDELGQWVNSNGGPPDDTRGTFTVTGGIAQADAPDIVTVEASPSTATSGQTITLTARVTSPVGVSQVGLQAQSTEVEGNTSFCDGYGTLTSGTATDGIWTLSCVVPGVVVPGEYVVYPYAMDVLGQWTNSNGGPLDDARGYFTIG